MSQFLQYAVSGLSIGALYALVALGLVLIYRSTRILNFGHGDVATVGTFFAFTLLSHNVSGTLAFLARLGAVLAMVFYFVVLIPAQRRNATQLGQIILTVGLSLIFQGLVSHFWGTEPQSFPFPLSDTKTWKVYRDVVISELSLGRWSSAFGSLALFF
jgi:branched-chain amino acid transport system permease protein